MTEHRYLQVCSDTTDRLLECIGVDADYVAAGNSYYTVETHIRHLDECAVGSELYSTLQLLSHDEKRLHVFTSVFRTDDNKLLATAEQLLLHVNSDAGKAAKAPPPILDKLQAIAEAHKALPVPDGAGRHVAQSR